MPTIPSTTEPWLQFSVNNYFNTFNWDGQAAPMQQFTPSGNREVAPTGPLSLDWSVGQFMNAVNWEGTHAVAPTTAAAPGKPAGLMLTDFSDLFG